MADTDSVPIPELKAAGVNSMIAVLGKMTTPERFAAFVRSLPTATASLITRPRLAQEWIALADIDPLYTMSLHGLFDGDMHQLYELGRLQLRADMSGIYRVFLRVASPAFVADRAAAIYGVYGQHCGSLRVVGRTDHSLDFLVGERPFPSPPLFEYLRGTVAGALELTGVKDLAVDVAGRPGVDSCLFRARWT